MAQCPRRRPTDAEWQARVPVVDLLLAVLGADGAQMAARRRLGAAVDDGGRTARAVASALDREALDCGSPGPEAASLWGRRRRGGRRWPLSSEAFRTVAVAGARLDGVSMTAAVAGGRLDGGSDGW